VTGNDLSIELGMSAFSLFPLLPECRFRSDCGHLRSAAYLFANGGPTTSVVRLRLNAVTRPDVEVRVGPSPRS
jgi:hypothetical protein